MGHTGVILFSGTTVLPGVNISCRLAKLSNFTMTATRGPAAANTAAARPVFSAQYSSEFRRQQRVYPRKSLSPGSTGTLLPSLGSTAAARLLKYIDVDSCCDSCSIAMQW